MLYVIWLGLTKKQVWGNCMHIGLSYEMWKEKWWEDAKRQKKKKINLDIIKRNR